jgi:hypothetical protein
MNFGQSTTGFKVTSVFFLTGMRRSLKTPKHRWVLPISTVSICLNHAHVRFCVDALSRVNPVAGAVWCGGVGTMVWWRSCGTNRFNTSPVIFQSTNLEFSSQFTGIIVSVIQVVGQPRWQDVVPLQLHDWWICCRQPAFFIHISQ